MECRSSLKIADIVGKQRQAGFEVVVVQILPFGASFRERELNMDVEVHSVFIRVRPKMRCL